MARRGNVIHAGIFRGILAREKTSEGLKQALPRAGVAQTGKQGTTTHCCGQNCLKSNRGNAFLARPFSRNGVLVTLLLFSDRRYRELPKPAESKGCGNRQTIEEFVGAFDLMIRAPARKESRPRHRDRSSVERLFQGRK